MNNTNKKQVGRPKKPEIKLTDEEKIEKIKKIKNILAERAKKHYNKTKLEGTNPRIKKEEEKQKRGRKQTKIINEKKPRGRPKKIIENETEAEQEAGAGKTKKINIIDIPNYIKRYL